MSITDPLIGQRLGDYVLQRLLGSGGMARVYLGYDEKLDRYAAVKVGEPRLVGGEYDEEFRERFLHEARAIARLKHPGIVGVYQFNQVSSLYYMAMELVKGRNLHQMLKEYARQEKAIAYEEVLRIIHDVAEALDYAHEQGIIHRDIKPSNIMIKEDGHAVLMDFGLALNVPEGTIGNTFGSVHYIAPEQAISSAQAVPQSDLYSLGVVLYEMLTGRVPFDDVSAMSVALKHISDPPPPASQINPRITPPIEALLAKALDKDPNKRFATGAEFVEALENTFTRGGQVDPRSDVVGTQMMPIARADDSEPASQPVVLDDDIPTVLDTSSRPKTLGGTSSSSQPAGSAESTGTNGTPRGLIMLGVVILLIMLAVVIFAVSNFGGTGDEASASPTAVAVGVVTEEVTDTVVPTDTPAPTLTWTPEVTETQTSSAVITTVTVSRTPRPTVTPGPTQSYTPEPSAASSLVPSQTQTHTPAPTVTHTPTAAASVVKVADPVLLRYNAQVFAVFNTVGDSIDISQLTFAQRTDSGIGWVVEAGEWTTGDLTALESDQCYYILSVEFLSIPAESEFLLGDCSRQGFLQTNRRFWIADDDAVDFEVRQNGVVLAICLAAMPGAQDEMSCRVSFEGSVFIPPEPTDTPKPTQTPAVSAAAATPTEPAMVGPDDGQALLVYDGRTLVLFNRDPDLAIDISRLEFVQKVEGRSSIRFRSSEWSAGDLSALGPSRCYQVWSIGYRRLPADEFPADRCLVREGFNQTSRAFWIGQEPEANFEVRRNGVVLAVCPAAAADELQAYYCAVDVRPSG